ncbi:MAG TPA: universal stress protein [Candidatus Acidoferrum sp.]|nr:universal stress protein [Candidatus Acidoferrum sp.]
MTKLIVKDEMKAPASFGITESKMIRLENILVGTDFSAASDRALQYALALARRYESKIFLVNVVLSDTTTLAPEVMTRGEELRLSAAQEEMGEFLISGRLRDVAHETLVERGQFWPTMQHLIEKHHIDLVVVGTEGTKSWQKFFLGSGAEQVFRQAKCPVLTVGPAVKDGAPKEIEFKKILFATDFGLGAEREAEYAFSFAQENQANLTMLHVVRHADDYTDEGLALKRAAISHELSELAPAGSEAWCKVEMRMRLGDPAEEILAIAREMKADLIVIGAKKEKSISAGHALGGTAYHVVCAAPCPVLSVRS